MIRPAMLRALGLALCGLSACESAAPEPVRASDETVRALLTGVYHPGRGVDQRTLREIVAARHTEFVPVLVELLRFERSSASGIPDALERLTGERLGADWPAWVEWLGAHELPTPAGFDAWKADLFATIDGSFRVFLYGGVPTRIRLEEIVWGGVRKDGIPALVNPKLVAARDASYMTDGELVFGLAIDGDARAYPPPHPRLARDGERRRRRCADRAHLLNALRFGHRVCHSTRRQDLRLWLFWVPLSQQQADVRPRDEEPLALAHR